MSQEYQQDAEQTQAPQAAQGGSKLFFVRPIGFDTSREAVEELFAAVGPVVDVQLMRGYAFFVWRQGGTSPVPSIPCPTQTSTETRLQIEFAKREERDTRGQFRVKVNNARGYRMARLHDYLKKRQDHVLSLTFAKVFTNYDNGETVARHFAFLSLSPEEADSVEEEVAEATSEAAVVGFRGGRDDFRGGRGGGFRGGRGRDDGFRGGRGGFRGRGGYDRDDNRGG
ncbi:hypothetical protein JCM33374_g3687 [Metschnikowia sp. JCM 33374]|nr:hypothetical protein JCM33374_g3687 [Metschnikowia sp. JCM 33374]